MKAILVKRHTYLLRYLDIYIRFYYITDSLWCIKMAMVFNATFNNISAISWRSVLLVEETGVLGEKHRPVASH
jgi:hypothetical protein